MQERERVVQLLELLAPELMTPETTALVFAAVADGRSRDDICPEIMELTRRQAAKQKADLDVAWAKVGEAQQQQAARDEEIASKVDTHRVSAEEEARRRSSASFREACGRLVRHTGRQRVTVQ